MYYDAFQVYELLDKWNPHGPPDAAEMQALFQRNPEAAKQEFVFGQTLLHKCVEHYSNRLDLVQILMEAHPDVLTQADDNGFLPLHRALLSGSGSPSLELVQLFVNQAPEALFDATPTGTLPLHLAAARYEDSAAPICDYLLSLFPDAIQHRDNQGKFPLHHALEAGNPRVEVVQRLVQAYPLLLSLVDEDGYLPLHKILAKSRRRYDAIVEVLVDHGPAALRFQTPKSSLEHPQKTPLLLACEEENSLSQIYSLVRKWPEQIIPTGYSNAIFEDRFFNGELLPSTLASTSATLDQLKKWLDLYPFEITRKDLQGRLPLHYAALSASPDALAMVEVLLEREEGEEGYSGADVTDLHQRLPLHYASAAANGSIVERLLQVYPEALTQEDLDGRLPWHYAECSRQDLVFEQTISKFSNQVDTGNLDLIPDEIRWDVLQVVHDTVPH